MSIFKEFKQFISRGNVIDIAIGFIIGAAFAKISSSLVSDVIMPPIGLLIDDVNFSELIIPLKPAVVGKNGEIVKPAVGIYYGKFIQTIIDFFIISFAVFIIFKVASALKKKEPPKAPSSPVKSDETLVLEQIRDILKEKN